MTDQFMLCLSCAEIISMSTKRNNGEIYSTEERLTRLSNFLINRGHSISAVNSFASILRNNENSSDFICLSCLNCLKMSKIQHLFTELSARLQTLSDPVKQVQIVFQVPYLVNASRIAGMLLPWPIEITKTSTTPKFETILTRYLSFYLLQSHRLQVVTEASFQLSIQLTIASLGSSIGSGSVGSGSGSSSGQQQHQSLLTFCEALSPEFYIKKRNMAVLLAHSSQSQQHQPAKQPSAADHPQVQQEQQQNMKEQVQQYDAQDIPQGSVDKILCYLRSLDHNQAGIQALFQRLASFFSPSSSSSLLTSTWSIASCDYAYLHLYGRYRKYARDLSQTPWTTLYQQGDAELEEVLASSRIGRSSVQELIGQAVSAKLAASTSDDSSRAVQVTLHGCGREDMDVRCLGNGRPFVLQVQHAQRYPTPEICQQIMDLVNNQNNNSSSSTIAEANVAVIAQSATALTSEQHHQPRQPSSSMQLDQPTNQPAGQPSSSSGQLHPESKDIEIEQLQVVPISIWEGMQTEAEEKKKGYCCLIYTQQPMKIQTKKDLAALKQLIEVSYGQRDLIPADDDELDELDDEAELTAVGSKQAKRCLQILQKTPLRVLHRRSLIDRPRTIYGLKVKEVINEHFLLLTLITSAGTYVKEFVHGDCGRTMPNLSMILGCHTEIVQLDVIHLYDHFDKLLHEANVNKEKGMNHRQQQPKKSQLLQGSASAVVNAAGPLGKGTTKTESKDSNEDDQADEHV